MLAADPTLIDLLPFTFQSTEGAAGTTQPIPDGDGGFVGTNPATGTIQQPIDAVVFQRR